MYGPLLANMGTALMFGACFWLLVGNAIIGRGEAWLLRRAFDADKKRSIVFLIYANYVSALAGLLLLPLVHSWLTTTIVTGPPLHAVRPMYYVMWLVAFVLTTLIEWPFCVLALEKGRRGPWRSLRASLVVQTASYALLTPLYLLVAQYGVVTDFRVVGSADFAANNLTARVYYIAAEDGDVHSINLDGTDERNEYQLDADDRETTVFGAPALVDESAQSATERHGTTFRTPALDIAANTSDELDLLNSRWALWVTPDSHDCADARPLGPLAGVPGVSRRILRHFEPHPIRTTEEDAPWGWRLADYAARHFYDIDLFGLEDLCDWSPPVVLIRGPVFHRAGEVRRLTLEATYDNWRCEQVTQLPGGIVVCNVDGQVLLADLEEQRITVLALGRDPVVVVSREALAALYRERLKRDD